MNVVVTHIELEEAGKVRALTRKEFAALELRVRVRALLEHRLHVFSATGRLETAAALKALSATRSA